VSAPACERGYDADDILSALDEAATPSARARAEAHVASCDECRAVVRVRQRARAAWSASVREASAATAAAPWPRPRVLPRRAFAFGFAAAAAVAALALATSKLVAPSPAVAVVAASSGGVSAKAPPSSGEPSVGAVDAGGLAAPSRVAHLVALGVCAGCRADGARLEPGAAIAGRQLDVPRGGRLTLAFALPSGLVDPAVGADVDGPAAARVAEDATITLESGTARFRGVERTSVVVRGGRLAADGATFTVRIDEHGSAHVAVERGTVRVAASDAGEERSIDAGGELVVTAAPAAPSTATTAADAAAQHPAAAATPSARAAPPSGEAAVADARARYHEGDADGARAALVALTGSTDAPVARRAEFTLAEIELASGERARGRSRLERLVACPDPSLARDAATLLARSEPSAAARAAVWERYLATHPPSPHRERALLDRAEALLDAGRRAEARVILRELGAARLPDPQRRQLERVELKAGREP